MRLEISGSQVEVRVPLGVFILNKLEATERSSAPRPSPPVLHTAASLSPRPLPKVADVQDVQRIYLGLFLAQTLQLNEVHCVWTTPPALDGRK